MSSPVVRPSRALHALLFLLASPLAPSFTGCAHEPAPALATPSAYVPPATVLPPAFHAPAASPPPKVATASASEQSRRRDILDAAWTLVRDKHYDKTLGGVDWTAIRARYEPRALAAPSEATFYRVLNDMIGELGQSHMLVVGPGSEDDLPGEESVAAAKPASVGGTPPTPVVPDGAPRIEGAPGIAVPEAASAAASPAAAPPAGAPSVTSGGHDSVGDPGLTIRSIEGKPVVTAIRAGSSASRSALRLGYVITAIAGRPLADATRSRRPLRPAEERFAIRRAAAHRLEGAAGTKVTVAYLDANDRPGQVVLEREAMAGVPVEIGNLPPIYPNTQSRMMGDVGVVSFNFFLLSPVLADVQKAIARFRAAGVKAIILDVRGNPGGQGAMAIPIAAAFVREPLTLGSIQFRDFTQTLTARPSLDVTPFLGPLVVLTDEGSASTSEMLAGGLQEAKRATIVGETTLGAVLPSVVATLPHGAIMQYVVADFRTPKGVLLEDRGVRPDRLVMETRAAFRDGRDPILEAGLDVARQLIKRKKGQP